MADEHGEGAERAQSVRAAESRRYPDRERLSDAENEARFIELIRDREFAGTRPTANPSVIFTGGQPVSGKSHAKLQLGEVFGPAGYVDVGTDSLRVHHPRWLGLLAEDDVTAGHYTQLDAQAWVARCVEHAVSLRVNVMMDGTLSREAEVNDSTRGHAADQRAADGGHPGRQHPGCTPAPTLPAVTQVQAMIPGHRRAVYPGFA